MRGALSYQPHACRSICVTQPFDGHSPQTVAVQQLDAGAQHDLGGTIGALGALIGQTVEQQGVRGAVAVQPNRRLRYGRLKAARALEIRLLLVRYSKTATTTATKLPVERA